MPRIPPGRGVSWDLSARPSPNYSGRGRWPGFSRSSVPPSTPGPDMLEGGSFAGAGIEGERAVADQALAHPVRSHAAKGVGPSRRPGSIRKAGVMAGPLSGIQVFLDEKTRRG